MTPNGKGLAVVTGASRGIGAAIARQLFEEDHAVLAIARHFETGALPDGVRKLSLDLDRPDSPAGIAAEVARLEMPVSVLVNNAAIQRPVDLTQPFDAQRRADIEAELRLNLLVPIALTNALLDRMQRPGGTIAMVTSLVALHPKPSAPVYSASKAGLASFTASLRQQMRPLGLRVMELVPPVVETGMTEGRGGNKMHPEALALAVAEGLAAGREVVAPGLSRKVRLLNRAAPGVVAQVLARH